MKLSIIGLGKLGSPMTPWSEFHELRAADMKRGGVLIDCWRLFVEDPPDTVAEYIALGCGPMPRGKYGSRKRAPEIERSRCISDPTRAKRHK